MTRATFLSILPLLCLAAGAATTQPAHVEVRRGVVYTPSTNPAEREERRRNNFQQLARRIEPDLKGDPSRLPQYVDFFRREFVQDPRVFAFDASARARKDGMIVLSGYAEYPQHRYALERLLITLGFAHVEDQIEQLPSRELADRCYAFVSAARTGIFDRPRSPREQLTECLKDEPLWLLRKVHGEQSGEDYYLCHNTEGYVGHVAAADVRVVDRAAFVERMNPPRAQVADDRIERVIASAQSILGTNYVWGGRTEEGLDCSGLVKRAFGAVGMNLPRDADQQALVGKMVATRWCRDTMHRGDVLFFMSGRGTVNHTAIYLGGGKYIEAAGTVHVSSFNEGDAGYDARRAEAFCFARRIIGD